MQILSMLSDDRMLSLKQNEGFHGRRRYKSAQGVLWRSLGVPEESLGALWGCFGDPLEAPWGALGVPWPPLVCQMAK